MRIWIFTLFFFLIANSVMGIENDTLYKSRKSIFVIPILSYQQETSWAGGLVFGYFSKSNDLSKISTVSGSVVYTLMNQFLINLTPKIYLRNKKGYLYANLNFRKYPDYYYGIGNMPHNFKIGYVSHNFNLTLQPQYQLSKRIYAGLLLNFKTESLSSDSSAQFLETQVYQRFGNEGWFPYSQMSVGMLAAYDSRDNLFYPSRGAFLKLTCSVSPNWFGNNYKLTDFTIDARKYLPIFGKHLLAVQTNIAGIFGSNGVPFQLMPTLGGSDLLRGFRQGMYRDNLLFLVQTEYRLPVYKKLKAALFCSAGDVVNAKQMYVDKLKVGYGAGVRYELNDARVHLRFDIAKNNYGDNLQFYITATEAF